ncbi:MAG: HAD family hydrolase [Bacteroidales bacterium]|nr:HAD family hydrolase [Bacteroidales bacterium]
MSYRNVIFDLDGTLLNTLDDLSASVNHALGSQGLPLCSAAHVRATLGNGIRRLIEGCVPATCPPEQIEAVFSAFRHHYLEHSLDRTAPYDGIMELLQELHERGIGMALVSNKVDAAVQELHQRFFARYIEVAIGEGPETPPKPNPQGVWRAMEKLNADATTTLYIGDSEVDHATARAAGTNSCLVLWGFRDEAELRQLHAEHYLKTPQDFLSLLD